MHLTIHLHEDVLIMLLGMLTVCIVYIATCWVLTRE